MRTRKDSAQNPSPSKRPDRKPKVADFKTAQKKPLLLLSDEQIEQDWRHTHPNESRPVVGTHQRVYADATMRRKYRQAYVMRHWGQKDCKILFLTILGYTHKEAGFLAFMYPVVDSEKLRERLGSVDFVPR
jgi:hypothetical protein